MEELEVPLNTIIKYKMVVSVNPSLFQLQSVSLYSVNENKHEQQEEAEPRFLSL